MFPYEYRRALRQLAEAEFKKKQLEKKKEAKEESDEEPDVMDIEDSVTDPEKEKKVLVKLDKMRSVWADKGICGMEMDRGRM